MDCHAIRCAGNDVDLTDSNPELSSELNLMNFYLEKTVNLTNPAQPEPKQTPSQRCHSSETKSAQLYNLRRQNLKGGIKKIVRQELRGNNLEIPNDRMPA